MCPYIAYGWSDAAVISRRGSNLAIHIRGLPRRIAGLYAKEPFLEAHDPHTWPLESFAWPFVRLSSQNMALNTVDLTQYLPFFPTEVTSAAKTKNNRYQ